MPGDFVLFDRLTPILCFPTQTAGLLSSRGVRWRRGWWPQDYRCLKPLHQQARVPWTFRNICNRIGNPRRRWHGRGRRGGDLAWFAHTFRVPRFGRRATHESADNTWQQTHHVAPGSRRELRVGIDTLSFFLAEKTARSRKLTVDSREGTNRNVAQCRFYGQTIRKAWKSGELTRMNSRVTRAGARSL